MTEQLTKKVNRAIRLITNAVGGGQVEVSYSGGKDSDVILELVRMSGVRYRAIYKNTTIDPQGTIKHCKDNGVEIMQPKISFFELIEKSGFPTRRARFCCDKLKEYKVMDMAVQGIRRSESVARAKRYDPNDPIICRIYGGKDSHVNVILPILEWTDEDVAEFLAERGIKAHPLYYDDKGQFQPHRRLGCIGCPLSPTSAIDDFKKYPKMLKAWIRAGQKWWDSHPEARSHRKFGDVYELMYHNLFCRSYQQFVDRVRGGLFPEYRIDCKKYLEETFKIEL